jgi:hypothetical protein
MEEDEEEHWRERKVRFSPESAFWIFCTRKNAAVVLSGQNTLLKRYGG